MHTIAVITFIFVSVVVYLAYSVSTKNLTYQNNLHKAQQDAKQVEVDAVVHRCVARPETAEWKVLLHSPLVVYAKRKLSFFLSDRIFVELSTDLSSLNGP
jgi:hypothetical protein